MGNYDFIITIRGEMALGRSALNRIFLFFFCALCFAQAKYSQGSEKALSLIQDPQNFLRAETVSTLHRVLATHFELMGDEIFILIDQTDEKSLLKRAQDVWKDRSSEEWSHGLVVALDSKENEVTIWAGHALSPIIDGAWLSSLKKNFRTVLKAPPERRDVLLIKILIQTLQSIDESGLIWTDDRIKEIFGASPLYELLIPEKNKNSGWVTLLIIFCLILAAGTLVLTSYIYRPDVWITSDQVSRLSFKMKVKLYGEFVLQPFKKWGLR